MYDFLIPPLLGGIVVALVAGPLGSFLVWRRMAYFGDTLAHSALLGVALALFFQINMTLAVIIVCLFLTVSLVALQQQNKISSDTILGILAHSTLALGIVVTSIMDSIRIDLSAFLFGDLLSVGYQDLWAIYIGGAIILLTIWRLWNSFLSITVHEELAQIEGLPVYWVRLMLMMLVALVIAVAMKITGILLITALMIIPAASARAHAQSPETMAIIASVLGLLAVLVGMGGAYFLDTPLGPSIVVCTTLIFLLSYGYSLLKKQIV